MSYDAALETNTDVLPPCAPVFGECFADGVVGNSDNEKVRVDSICRWILTRAVLVFVNGVSVAQLQQTFTEPGGPAMSGTAQLRLALGDVVAIYYYSGLADTLNTPGSLTFATLERIK